MTKKYYARFHYNYGNEYVVMFKIHGSLMWDKRHDCFIDKDIYVRSIEEVLSMALDRSSVDFQLACLIDHKSFVELRAHGVKRWPGLATTIIWD